ncbi:TOMM system kinase/cyclase fusion protein [Melittangium boletus]|uniref:Protein kinase domain-containing protein n=1 Tax=Melittangium boletus DSM 14713 TaxID=1294270 RepID=A0A250I788_9BACT|nr:TOMM system kinase/cyclase fusion protein [Melittangium boletus]ATB27022.1 hypothetical protein MEBOL_000457 [Melittangium boletus DSM 14713]
MKNISSSLVSPGTVFQQRYEILSILGEGGFGQIHRARQLVTGQEVAVKVLRQWQNESAPAVARFKREMRLCAQLHHPHIVRLIDSGSTSEGLLYTVFELVPGQTLAEVLAAQGALGPWDAVQLMMQVLDALACAHGHGIVHRDLTPQNIMVTATGVLRHARVLDFGLGTLLPEGNQETKTPVTLSREGLGTPAYAAPEQLRGDPASPCSDLYSWGLIFLECLTGQPVIKGHTLQEVLYKQLGPDPLSLPPELEENWLGRLLQRVLVKEARERNVTAPELLRQLEAGLREGRLGGAAAGPVRTEPMADSHGELRQVTAVCCGLAVPGEGSEVLDVEELDQLLRAQYEACVEVAGRFGGSVGGALGDRVLIYFGLPHAAEDDARRAARAALEMAAEVEQRGVGLAASQGPRLALRVGLHTGLVIYREPQTDALGRMVQVGQTPREAALLEAMAEPGTILVSAHTAPLLREHYLLGPATLSGRIPGAHGPGISRLYGALQAESVTPGREERPLFGRAGELELLQQRWIQVRQGQGQTLLIIGEPGMGKSRLVRELMRQAGKTPHLLLECRCAPENRQSALRPVVELLERLLGIQRNWSAERSLGALEALLSRYGFNLAQTMPLFAPLLNLPLGARHPPLEVSPQRHKELTFNALISLFFEMTTEHPVLLLMEDLHWSDPTTLELVGHLSEELAPTNLLLVLTARPEFSAPWQTSRFLQLRLNRLEPREVERMVAGLAGSMTLPREVIEQVASRADGVPLFVEQLTRVMLDDWPAQGQGAPTREPEPAIPTTLRDLLMSRLDRLGPARETAQYAAALGREFSYEMLRAVSAREETALKRELAILMETDLVQRRRGARGMTYLFKHALIQDAAYASILKSRRREMHKTIARTLEERFPEVVESRPELLARHHEEAGHAEKAAHALHQAGQKAMQRAAYPEAISSLMHAIKLASTLSEPRARDRMELELRATMSGALIVTGGYCSKDLEANCLRARELCSHLGKPPELVPVLYTLMVVHLTASQLAPTLVYARELLEAARTHPTPLNEITSAHGHGLVLFYSGRLEEARAEFHRSTQLYSPELHDVLVRTYGDDHGLHSLAHLEWLYALTGEIGKARAFIARTLAQAEQQSDPLAQALARTFASITHRLLREHEKVRELNERTIPMCAEQGFPFWLAMVRQSQGWAVAMQGQVDEGIREIEQGSAFFEAIQFKMRAWHLSNLVDIHMASGDYERGLTRVEEAIHLAETYVESFYLPELFRQKGELLRARGEPDTQVMEWFERALAKARESKAAFFELRAAKSMARLLEQQDSRARARELLSTAMAKIHGGDDTVDYREAAQLLERLSAA